LSTAISRSLRAVRGRRTDSRARDEVDDGARNEELAGLCGVADALREVFRNTGDLLPASLDLARANSETHVERLSH
jgi:hypothetical protein